MKRPGYKEALYWIAANDDNEWITDEYGIMSVTACLVADLFGFDEIKVKRDLEKMIRKIRD